MYNRETNRPVDLFRTVMIFGFSKGGTINGILIKRILFDTF